jgi:galactosylceramidase
MKHPCLRLKRSASRSFAVLLVLGLFSQARPALALDITLDPNQPGRTFEGVGAVSAGASSRLLIDYPEPQRSQILDYLFKPNYGAALQHLKVEIGGEVNSTDGTEPTHMRTRTDQNYGRGYEWWLMQQAKARSPGILLDCLAWGAPGWIGSGNYYSQDMCDYIVNFLKGAQTQYGLTFDFTGTHNEAAVNTAWIKLLRSSLDASGLQNIQLVAADEWSGAWNIVTNSGYGLLVDPALSNAVARIGAHYPQSASPVAAQSCSKPLWASEDGIGGSIWATARKLGKLFNRNYVTGRMTKTEIWSPITSYYDILAASDSGLMRANTPWSGNYLVAPAIWAAAHTTQFAFPGWKYLEAGASALLPLGGSIVTLLSTNHADYSIVVETFDATAAQTVAFHLTNGLFTATLNLWQTTQASQFVQVGLVPVVGGTFTCTFQPECIYTLTTTSGQAKGSAVPSASAPFPLPFKDDFESYAPGKTPRFFSDQAGTFESFTRADTQGQCLRQVLPQTGIRWTSEWYPYTLIGDAAWTDYDASADVLIETNGGFAFVMGRVGSVPGFSDPLPRGYWLVLNNATAQWELHSSSNLLVAGAAAIPANTWHNLRLAMQGNSLRCYVDGELVTNVTDYSYTSGMAGLGCGWHGAQFDNFTLRRLHRTGLNLALAATASASSVWQNDLTYAASMANDGDLTTRWNSAYPTLSNEWLELDFPAPVTFNHTTYSQYASRIFGYQVQHWNGAGWRVDVNSGTMGAFASDVFPAVTSTRVRLVLTNFTSTPSIYEFGVYNDAASPDLALTATAAASSTWSSGYTAAMANDNNFSTRWNAGVGTSNGEWLELDWPAPVSFNRTVLWQFLNRITSYKIQHWTGTFWADDVLGGQLGPSKADAFPTVVAGKVRLLAVTATNVPSIWEFQVLDDPPPIAPLCINEWMSDNTRTLRDPAGGFQPWFELYNAGATNVSLAGYYLTGSLTNLFQFQVPAGYFLPPSGYLLVWTDGQTGQNTGGDPDLHVNFSLQQSQIIGLLNPIGQLVDAVDLVPQAADVSSGSNPDGDPAVLSLFAASPRQSNNEIWPLPPLHRALDGAMLLSFAGLAFAPHRVFAASTLDHPVWTNLAAVMADGLGVFTWADTNASAWNERYYRAASP